MKRIVALIDGTWNNEGHGADTNVAKLDPGNRVVINALILPQAGNGTIQRVHYHRGVGTGGGLAERFLGGAIGLGLKRIVQEVYTAVSADYAPGDELFILGFSRGAYAARALAGLIGASGLQKTADPATFEIAWRHYRVRPAARGGDARPSAAERRRIARYAASRAAFHDDRAIRCVAVWDTVGSYGVPAGFGLDSLARYVTLWLLGFHDTRFGEHIDVGLHAVAVDERRRPFVPTFWTAPKGRKPRGRVEQSWFAGVHCNVGGSYADSGLSDHALVWMIARLQALTGLEFDAAAVKASTRPNIDGEVYDSSKGWPVSRLFPHRRLMLSPDAIHHGAFLSTRRKDEEHINERIHWTVLAKRGRPCTVDGVPNTRYEPPNLPSAIPPDRIAAMTPEEAALLA